MRNFPERAGGVALLRLFGLPTVAFWLLPFPLGSPAHDPNPLHLGHFSSPALASSPRHGLC